VNYASAYILNKLVIALEKTRSTLDLALSSREYALANNTEERDIQLLYGLSSLKSLAYNNYYDTVSFGKSLMKSVTSNTNISFPTLNQESFSVYGMLGPLDEMSDGYVFGAVYLANDQFGSSLYISIARPADDYNGSPIIISKDIDVKGQLVIDTAKAAFKSGMIEGAKWQEERMYSEEEVIELLQKYRLDLSSGKTANIGDTTKFWFEQFKKK
jgi:hypothetical protein